MSFLATFCLYSLPFLGVVAIITLVHELGHFVVARCCGVRVEAFSLGFGREIVGWTGRHGTRYKLSLLPLGGYVKMLGEQGFVREANGRIRVLNREERARSYFHKSVGQRAGIVLAGPLVNIVFGLVVIAGLIYANGLNVPSPTLGEVPAGSPAATAGLRAGDRLVAVDGHPVVRLDAAMAAIGAASDRIVDLTIARDGVTLNLPLDLRAVPAAESGLVSKGGERLAVDMPTAAGESLRITGMFLSDTMTGLAEIATGRRSIDDLAGPVQIAQVTGETFINLGFGALVLLTALLSINIGVVNLLPIPVLDGGHLVFLAIEFVRRRPLSSRVLKICSLGGLFAILVIFVLITGHDLARIGLFG